MEHLFKWETLKPHEVLVLLVLASMIDEEKHVKANIEKLCQVTRLTGGQVLHALRGLAAKGAIESTGEWAHEGLATYTVYQFPEQSN